MPRSVFISYARDASRDHAVALYDALGGDAGPAFLDTEEIGVGEPFPERLVDALYDARVVVIFAEPTYFTRRYCLQEFDIACGPFFRVLERSGATATEKQEAIRGIFVVLPPKDVDSMLERFPPDIRGRNWHKVDEIDAFASLVRDELAKNPPTLRERHQALGAGEAERARFLASSQLPPPQRIGKIPLVPAAKLRPSINDAFVGRADDLWRVHNILATRGGLAGAAGLTVSLEAMGGVGKTRIALEYLWRFGTRAWQGGLFWINAEQDAELQLYDVLLALNPSAPDIATVRQQPGGVTAAAARSIRSLDGPRPLFIIDNIPEPEPGDSPKPLDTWCPVLGEVPVLVTSRNHVSLGAGDIAAVPVDTLVAHAAVMLLTEGVPHEQLRDSEWREIAHWVGHLPLALELLNRMIAAGAIASPAVLAMSRDQRPSEALDRGMEAIRHSVPNGALSGITEAFSASYDRLTPAQQNGARLIAWMAPEPMPEIVLDAYPPTVFTPSVRAALRTRSLVGEVRSSAGDYFGVMHRVFADYVRSRADSLIIDASVAVAGLLSVAGTAKEVGGSEGWVTMQRIGPVAGAMARNLLHMISQIKKEHADGPQTLSFMIGNLGGFLFDAGQIEGARTCWTCHLRTITTVHGIDHPDAITARSNLASAYKAAGDLARALREQESVVESILRRGDLHTYATIIPLHNLASMRRHAGDLDGAERMEVQALDLSIRFLGEEHPATLAILNGLVAILTAQEKFAEAIALQERVLRNMRGRFAKDDPRTLVAMDNLAHLLRTTGNLSEAIRLQETVVAGLERRLGRKHHSTLIALDNLASSYRDRGDSKRALELQREVVSTFREEYGDAHLELLVALKNLVSTLEDVGAYAEIPDLLRLILNATKEIREDGQKERMALMNHLFYALKRVQRYDEAQDVMQELIALQRERLGPEDDETLVSMNNLATVLQEQGLHDAARPLLEQSLSARERRFGVKDRGVFVTALNLFQALLALEDLDAATKISDRYLRWISDRDPSSLMAEEKDLYALLVNVFGPRDTYVEGP